jgi:uncharacterized membrane protein
MRRLQRFYVARPRMIYAALTGVVAGFAIPLPAPSDWLLHTLVGWNIAMYFYLALIWTMMLRADENDVRAVAERQDESAYAVLTAVSIAALMSLAAIIIELANVKGGSGPHPFHITITAATVVGSWFLIPTIFALHYAHFYYLIDKGHDTPLLFPQKGLKPDYWDFMYFSFTIAAASQTADIVPNSRWMRKVMLAQQVLSFFFNASILGLSINISASLVSG